MNPAKGEPLGQAEHESTTFFQVPSAVNPQNFGVEAEAKGTLEHFLNSG